MTASLVATRLTRLALSLLYLHRHLFHHVTAAILIVVMLQGNRSGWLGGTTGSASDQRSGGAGSRLTKVVCITVSAGNRMGVNCPLWPAATPSSEL